MTSPELRELPLSSELTIVNPKRTQDITEGRSEGLFPYYAGYSAIFAETLIESMQLPKGSLILDPWNGSGTTTSAAVKNGLRALGIDLNPVMVIVAKASLVSRLDVDSLVPIAHAIIEKAQSLPQTPHKNEPLQRWFSPLSSSAMRNIEKSINNYLINAEEYVSLNKDENLSKTTPLAAFFYLCLFRAIRRLSSDFIPSNPTWIRTPKTKQERKRPSLLKIHKFFINEVATLSCYPDMFLMEKEPFSDVVVKLSNAENLPIPTESVDSIITSPPYCTRIDYAVATYIELAALGISEKEFNRLRRSLTGTSTVQSEIKPVPDIWGPTCQKFLADVYSHPSKASKTYYYKNHMQYFESLWNSLREAARVLKRNSSFILVVQDSHYKEVHNDIATICIEMLSSMSLRLSRRQDFSAKRTMASLNKNSKKYAKTRGTTESVICFEKQ